MVQLAATMIVVYLGWVFLRVVFGWLAGVLAAISDARFARKLEREAREFDERLARLKAEHGER